MRDWVRVGVLAWACELLLCMLRGWGWFLQPSERVLFAAGAGWLVPGVTLGAYLVDRVAGLKLARRRAMVLAVASSVGLGGGWTAWLLTEGRRVRDWSGRPIAVALVAIAAGAGLLLFLRVASRLREQETRAALPFAAFAAAAAVVCGAVDTWVLPRGYPAFHNALTALALAGWVLAAWMATAPTTEAETQRPVERPSERLTERATALFLALVALTALVALPMLARSPNAGYATELSAPWTGKLLSWSVGASSADTGGPVALEDPSAVMPGAGMAGIDLRDQNVLLITVDALRADVVGSGRGLTPHIDQLASESVVFRRAYTPTPHTSYALASLMTAKPLREVMGLQRAGAAADHVTVADLLRRYGYRTAAFYPPAIFFVDGSRFETLNARGLGFEYSKKMFASARDRVSQLRTYLASAPPEHPLFVWVHLFEPHEPYAAPEGKAASDAPRDRYDAEVRYVDAAVGDLVAAFRASRPGATVVLSADHGEEFGDHGGHYHGTTLFDEQVRIPLLWSSPGKAAPALVDVPVELLDVGTTLLAAAGVPRDARMRGDDLGAVLAGEAGGPAYAFASVDDRYMVMDGRYKAVCRMRDTRCRLYDLRADPAERVNLAARETGKVASMRAALARHLGSIAHGEVTALADGGGWPEPLVRARLGAPGVGPDLVPLLSDSRPEVRCAALQALGELHFEAARPILERLQGADPSDLVRRDAGLALCVLESPRACESVAAGLSSESDPVRARRAAKVLAQRGRSEGAAVLIELALDGAAEEGERVEAIQALGELKTQAAVVPLIELLGDVRLRVAVSDALGQIPSRASGKALAAALVEERYPPARHAEARALVRLNVRQAAGLIQRMLGTESSVPGGVSLLVEAGALSPRATGQGGVLSEGGSAMLGAWTCAAATGCRPDAGAELRLPRARAPRGPARAVLWIAAPAGGGISLDGNALVIAPGQQQVSVALPAASGRRGRQMAISVEGAVSIRAIAVVAQRDDIAPPPPEPWKADAGVHQGHEKQEDP